MFLVRIIIIFQQPGEVKTTTGNNNGKTRDDGRLHPGSFQVVGPIINQGPHFSIEPSHLPLFGLVISEHGEVIVQIRRTGSQPINDSGADDSQRQDDDANQPETMAPARRLRAGCRIVFRHTRVFLRGTRMKYKSTSGPGLPFGPEPVNDVGA